MSKFKEVPASNLSNSNRKLLYGVGINDSIYAITKCNGDGGIISRCPYYAKWSSMIRRCYSVEYHKLQPTYKDCAVCDEWLLFSNFRAWMVKQDWVGMELDKDIKIKGNKVYSPETCLFVPRVLNSLLGTCGKRRGLYPLGVSLDRQTGKYRAEISSNGKRNKLGRFDTPELASASYQAARKNKITELISDNICSVATPYLAQHILGETYQ